MRHYAALAIPDVPPPHDAERETAAPGRRFPQTRDREADYFTPCISRWINGAISSSSTPAPISSQKPMV